MSFKIKATYVDGVLEISKIDLMSLVEAVAKAYKQVGGDPTSNPQTGEAKPKVALGKCPKCQRNTIKERSVVSDKQAYFLNTHGGLKDMVQGSKYSECINKVCQYRKV